MNSVSELDSYKIALSSPVAAGGDRNVFSMYKLFQQSEGGGSVVVDPSYSPDTTNLYDGFPEEYAILEGENKKFVERGDLNQLAYLATSDMYARQSGMLNFYNQDVANLIGGYPANAVLDWFDGNGMLCKIRCKKAGGGCIDPFSGSSEDENWEIVLQNNNAQLNIADLDMDVLNTTFGF